MIVTLRIEMEDGTILEVPREAGDPVESALTSVVFEDIALKLTADVQLLVEARYGVPSHDEITIGGGTFPV